MGPHPTSHGFKSTLSCGEMLSHLMWRKALKGGLHSFVPSFVAYHSSVGKATGHCLDQAIKELNQEMECVLGPSGDNERASPFTNSTSTLGSTSFNSHEQSGSSAETVMPLQGPLHSSTSELSHVDAHGKVTMVNVSEKISSKRVAIASGKVLLGPIAFPLVSANQISKGDVLAVAKIAGICGAKQTGSLIPLCHNLALSNVQVSLELNEQEQSVIIKAEVAAVGVTGVEMEALTAVSVAALTVYDMCKAVSKDITINNVQLESKMGGKSGGWCRTQNHG